MVQFWYDLDTMKVFGKVWQGSPYVSPVQVGWPEEAILCRGGGSCHAGYDELNACVLFQLNCNLYKAFTNLVPVAWHECHLAVRMSLAYRFQTADDTYVIFWELLGQIVTSLLLLLQFQKKKITYFVHVCFFLLSLLSSFLNPVAHFSHILQRKVEVLGIVNCSSRLENRRGNGFCTSESLCRQET